MHVLGCNLGPPLELARKLRGISQEGNNCGVSTLTLDAEVLTKRPNNFEMIVIEDSVRRAS
jgi:hypothetical protein